MGISISNFDADPFTGSTDFANHGSSAGFAVDVVPNSGEVLTGVFVFVNPGLENFDVNELAFNGKDVDAVEFESGYLGGALGNAGLSLGTYVALSGTFKTDGGRIIVPARFGGWSGNQSDNYSSHSFDVVVVAFGDAGTAAIGEQTFENPSGITSRAIFIDDISPALESTLAANDPVGLSLHTTAPQTNFPRAINIDAWVNEESWEAVYGPRAVAEPKWPTDWEFREGYANNSTITPATDLDGNDYFEFSIRRDDGWRGPFLLVPTAHTAQGVWGTNETLHWDAPVVADGGGGSDETDPVISNPVPAEGPIEFDTPVGFDVTDPSGNLLRKDVSVYYPQSGNWEVVYYAAISGSWGDRREGFAPNYVGDVATITNGFRFSNVIHKSGTWPTRPIIVVGAVDTAGNEG